MKKTLTAAVTIAENGGSDERAGKEWRDGHGILWEIQSTVAGNKIEAVG